MANYSVGTQWNYEKTEKLLTLVDSENVITDIYGALPNNLIGHGRSPYAVPNLTYEKAKRYIRMVQQKGITFNYLLNGYFDSIKLHDSVFVQNLLKFIETLVEDLQITFVTIARPELIRLVNREFPSLRVKLSTIHNTLSVEDLRSLEDLDFQKVTLGNDAPRNFPRLIELIHYTTQRGIEPENMISETCIFQCPTRSDHYYKLSKKDADFTTDWYMNNCTVRRIINPEEIFKACWIRPEDLDQYINLGLKNFKISGRDKSPEWTEKCLTAYFARKYSGNLMDILGTTPPDFESRAEHLYYIDNDSLDNFLAKHPKDCYDLSCDSCNYCLEAAINLYSDGRFRINPICGTYQIKDGKFICEPGPYTEGLLKSLKENRGR